MPPTPPAVLLPVLGVTTVPDRPDVVFVWVGVGDGLADEMWVRVDRCDVGSGPWPPKRNDRVRVIVPRVTAVERPARQHPPRLYRNGKARTRTKT
jgi:hypothetical protein